MRTEIPAEKRESSSDPHEQPSSRRKLRTIVVAISLSVVGFIVATILGTGGLLAATIATGGTLATLTAAGTIPLSATIASLVLTELGYLGVGSAYIHRWLDGVGNIVRIPTRREIGWIVGGTIAALTPYLIVVLLFPTALQNVTTGLSDLIAANPLLMPIIGGLSIVLVGPAEELLFRGAIQGRLRRAFGGGLSVLLAAILFASIHTIGRTGPLFGVLVSLGIIFTVGLVLGIAYERTGNLTVNMLIHGLYNAAISVIAYVSYLL